MLNQPFFQVALPIMVTMVGTVWVLISTNNKRLDELSKRLDDFASRLGRIEDRLLAIENRLGAVERKVDWNSRRGDRKLYRALLGVSGSLGLSVD